MSHAHPVSESNSEFAARIRYIAIIVKKAVTARCVFDQDTVHASSNMSNRLLLTNSRIVTPTGIVHGTLDVLDGQIGAIDPGSTAVADAIDLEGDLLLPGLVELHTDNLERHLMPRPKVYWPTLPALLAHDAEMVAMRSLA